MRLSNLTNLQNRVQLFLALDGLETVLGGVALQANVEESAAEPFNARLEAVDHVL